MLWVCVLHHVFITSSCWSHFTFSLIGAEFKKTDRSLLVSPDGSSRVPFDPQQKPKFGVLKAPPTPLSANVKRTPAGKKKGGAPKSTPKRRVVASDFFWAFGDGLMRKFILEFYVLCICVCIWVTRIKLLASVFPHSVSDSFLCDRRTKRRSGHDRIWSCETQSWCVRINMSPEVHHVCAA